MSTVAKFTALVLVAIVPAGLAAFGRPAHAEHREQPYIDESSVVPPPPPVVPASAADLKSLTEAVNTLREHVDARLGKVEEHVATITGYIEAKKQADLEQALRRKGRE